MTAPSQQKPSRDAAEPAADSANRAAAGKAQLGDKAVEEGADSNALAPPKAEAAANPAAAATTRAAESDPAALAPAEKPTSAPVPTTLPFALAIFGAAFLLFGVQPLMGKVILPWFGGTPAVWTTCLLFFQTLLLAGYLYAHVLTRFLSPGRAVIVHAGLLAMSLAALPIHPSDAWKPSGAESPTVAILLLLTAVVGLPYFLLASTSPLLQAWFARLFPGRDPYWLYALSNGGSLLGLLGYPFLFEPLLRLRQQTTGWSVLYAGMAIAAGYCGWQMLRHGRGHAASRREPDQAAAAEASSAAAEASAAEPPGWADWFLWVAASACGSALLMATTNQICQELASGPLLWIVPLALYLITFILVFDHQGWYRREWWVPIYALSMMVVVALLWGSRSLPMALQVPAYSQMVFVGCMVLHGELAAHRPHPRYLTNFYLSVSLGGALGGVLVGIVAPLLLDGFWEFHFTLIASLLILELFLVRDGAIDLFVGPRRFLGMAFTLAIGSLGFVLFEHIRSERTYANASTDNYGTIERLRNFYGTLRISRSRRQESPYYNYLSLVHGQTVHGMQLQEPGKTLWPTSYYGYHSGVGLAVSMHPKRLDLGSNLGLNIGVVGLGVGTLAAHTNLFDTVRFYEISPDVVRLAEKYFTFLKRCPAKKTIVMGDARLSLERELKESLPALDILVIDAFSSDAIPMHLITREAMAIYLARLASDGILAIHVSNQYLDLTPVVVRLAQEFPDLHVLQIDELTGDPYRATDPTTWLLVTRNEKFLSDPVIRERVTDPEPVKVSLWTDDYSNILEVWREQRGISSLWSSD